MNQAAPGKLIGVGVGPGDPELLTIKAARAIENADVIAYHKAKPGSSNARATAADHIHPHHIELPLTYPITTGTTNHPGGYTGAINDFYTEATHLIATHLDAGRTVAVLAEGDPFLYSSFQHLHERLAHTYPTQVIPGISSMTAVSTALGRPLVEATETLTILPGTLPTDELAARLATADCAVIMKLGRTFTSVRQALTTAGRLHEAWYVERVSHDEREVVTPLADVNPNNVPYFSLAVIPSRIGTADWMPAPTPPSQKESSCTGYVDVCGLGPAGAMWRSPQVTAALAQATDIIGYTTYVKRVPERPGLTRHLSDNKVELERAEFALDLALRGHRVAVVSSGDAGIFAMATAVLEAADQERYRHIPVRILPGITAAAAVAATVGAPIGHDFATISLSDRLKPFEVIRERVRAAAQADLVIALYNPASKERTWQLRSVIDDLRTFRAETTPVVVARAVGSESEKVTVTTLGDLDPDTVDMRTALIIGSTQTRLSTRMASGDRSTGAVCGDGTQHVLWTPRTYPQQ
ncbi:precorrin-2 C(20)-methyltransferase [Dermatophilus congolensis]|uniref:precorrin-2 C(20)-methyltransferase n=1 Tax=Dermatophilus congolensis TaxID=1863 RepID=UPI001AB0366E|nr:precorrin-2 C(20)-methyltransferase [Dermatophilus congolensis]MBO3145131.1 precorrin-2 C(20)-methyltransferase [Dermatophilus congolensis]